MLDFDEALGRSGDLSYMSIVCTDMAYDQTLEGKLRIYLIVAVNQNVPHAFDDIPFNFRMSFPEFLAEHVDGLANNLQVLDEAVIDDGVTDFFRRGILDSALFDGIDGIQDMLESFPVSNWLSHIQEFYRGLRFLRQMGVVFHPQ